jgi:SEC-C motif domain protein
LRKYKVLQIAIGDPMLCPCQSKLDYKNCCEPYIEKQKLPPTAEALMRSRYSAYTLSNIEYLKSTLAPESRHDFDMKASEKWAKEAEWLGLEVISTKQGLQSDKRGVVEFMVKFKQNGEVIEHHEVSRFRKTPEGQWYFVDGDAHTHKEGETHHHHKKLETVVNTAPKVGRNDPCTCGSGKKYKKCCGSISAD